MLKIISQIVGLFLCNSPEISLNCHYYLELYKNYSTNNKPLSDTFPFFAELILLPDTPNTRTNDKIAFNSNGWNELNIKITTDPFDPFFHSNVNFLVEQFYTWLINQKRDHKPRQQICHQTSR